MTQAILHSGSVLRQIAIGQLQSVPEAQFDLQPAGFNNTVRWNAGHIVYWMDRYLTLSFGTPSAIPASYEALFNSGTRPSDWTIAPPTKDELIRELSEQLAALSDLQPERLVRPLRSPFEFGPFRFATAGELFNFALIHEAIHLGTIASQLKVLASQS